MKQTQIGLLHPGTMGVSIGAAALAAGSQVAWASQGRSAATQKRAQAFADLATIAAISQKCAVILSVCPPAAALDLAREVAATGFSGIYVDANAVSPGTSRAVGEIVTKAGANFVDGGIIGPPAHKPGSTRLYLAGHDAPAIAALFGGSNLEAIAIGDQIGGASALKMCYAAYTKGTSALLIAIRALAEAEGITPTLLQEWDLSQTGLSGRSANAASANAAKAWRFEGEMLEIAASFEAVGLPGGFHQGAAELYRRMAGFKDQAPPSIDEVIATLLK